MQDLSAGCADEVYEGGDAGKRTRCADGRDDSFCEWRHWRIHYRTENGPSVFCRFLQRAQAKRWESGRIPWNYGCGKRWNKSDCR